MSFHDPKPGRNRRKFKHGPRNYAKDALKSRYSEKYSEKRATKQAGKIRARQQDERHNLALNKAPMRPRHGRVERQSFRLAPIHGFLRKRIGQPWRDVKAELAALLLSAGHSGYAAYREITEREVWNEYFNGPVAGAPFNKPKFYIAKADGSLRFGS
jgi:hypothetical protein